MYQAGTVTEMLALKRQIPEEVYREALSIVTMLDEHFGEDRDVEEEDGGIVLIATNGEDLEYFSKRYLDPESGLFEYVELVKTGKEPYLNVFYLYNEYTYGISLFLPLSIAPRILQEEVLQGTNHS